MPALEEYPKEHKSENLRDHVLKPGFIPARTQENERVDTDLDAKYVF